MPNRIADELFHLIKTLEKGEKRNFKLYVSRNISSDELKIITLFDAIDKLDQYDEEVILKKIHLSKSSNYPILNHIYTSRFYQVSG